MGQNELRVGLSRGKMCKSEGVTCSEGDKMRLELGCKEGGG